MTEWVGLSDAEVVATGYGEAEGAPIEADNSFTECDLDHLTWAMA